MITQDLDWGFLRIIITAVIILDLNTQLCEECTDITMLFKLLMRSKQLSLEKDSVQEITLPSIVSLIRYPYNTTVI